MGSNKIKFAVVGQGHIGRRHAEMIRRNEEAELISVCDVLSKSELGISEITEKYFSSIDELLANSADVDVVSICTPNGLHAEHSLRVLEAGKHVVCEKPMALTKADCEKVILKAKEKNKKVFCVMQNRFSPPAVWLKLIVDDKTIGDIYMVQLNCFWNRDERYYLPYGQEGQQGNWRGIQESDGGTLFTQFSHFIDIMYWLCGDIKDIQAKFNDFNHSTLTEFEDSGMINFNFVKGGMGGINYSTAIWDKNFESSITIIGSNGSVKVGGQYMDKVEYCHLKNYSLPQLDTTENANDYGTYKGSANNHPKIFENVIDTLKGRTAINTSAEDGMKVVEIIERIYSLRNTNRKS